MRVLDLFCGAGGAAMGYYRAGFEVVGVDIKPQLHYPFEFHQGDAMEWPLEGFDVVHASPPCQGYSKSWDLWKRDYPRLIEPLRKRLVADGKPYVIENVPGAPLVDPVVLCGESFGLRVIRHRLFESNLPVKPAPHVKHRGRTIRKQNDGGYYYKVCGHETGKASWPMAMGIDWMKTKEIVEAIPPAYTEFIGRQIMEYLKGEGHGK